MRGFLLWRSAVEGEVPHDVAGIRVKINFWELLELCCDAGSSEKLIMLGMAAGVGNE
jgi:hypothetical protein